MRYPRSYSEEQLHKVWNPETTGAVEERIDTNLGFINTTHRGKVDGPAIVFWPSTVVDWWLPIVRNVFCRDTAEKIDPESVVYCGVVPQDDPKSIAWAPRGTLLGRTDTRRILDTIKDVPVLVIAGGEDRHFSIATSNSMADAISTSKFVVAEEMVLAPLPSPDLSHARKGGEG